MNQTKNHEIDTQLEELREDRRQTTGELRLYHLSGPPQSYVLSAWHMQVGDMVRVSEVIATVETISHTLDIQSYESGILTEQSFAVGVIIPDGAIIARIAVSPENSC